MSYNLRIIILIYAPTNIEAEKNRFLASLKLLQNPLNAKIAFAMNVTGYFANGFGTSEYFFDGSKIPDFSDSRYGVGFKDPGMQSTLRGLLEKAVSEQGKVDCNVIIVWGHGGGYFVYAGTNSPEILRQELLAASFRSTRDFSDILPLDQLQVLKSAKSNLSRWISGDEAIGRFFAFDNPLADRSFANLVPNISNVQFVLKKVQDEDRLYVIPKDELQVDMLRDVSVEQRNNNNQVLNISRLGMEEIKAEVDSIKARLGHVETLVFENCMMQCMENLYLFSSTIEYLVGSQDYLYPVDIGDADNIKSIIAASQPFQSGKIGIRLVTDFERTSIPADRDSTKWAYSCVKTDRAVIFAKELKELTETLRGDMALYRSAITDARKKCKNFTEIDNHQDIPITLVDLTWFLKNLQKTVANSNVKNKINNCINLLTDPNTGLIRISRKGTSRVENAAASSSYGANGINILFPKTRAEYNVIINIPSYREYIVELSIRSAFLNNSGWLLFLDSYL